MGMGIEPTCELLVSSSVRAKELQRLNDAEDTAVVELAGGAVALVSLADGTARCVGPSVTREEARALAQSMLASGVVTPDALFKLALGIIAFGADAERLLDWRQSEDA